MLEDIDHIHVELRGEAPAAGASTALPGSSAVRGTVYVTNYRLFFVPARRVVAHWPAHGCPCPPAGFALPLAAVQRIDRTRALERGLLVCSLVVRTKLLHALRLQYTVPAARSELPTLPDALLERLVFHCSLRRLFAFVPEWVAAFAHTPHPFRYDAAAEYARLGLPNATWAVGRFNPAHTRCATYPEVLCFPASFVNTPPSLASSSASSASSAAGTTGGGGGGGGGTGETTTTTTINNKLEAVFQFRSKGRVPCLVWVDGAGGAALFRCGQPSVGLTSARCGADEEFMAAIARAAPSGTLWIADARPKLAARANQLKGHGYEYGRHYRGCSIEFLGIKNIHEMRDAQHALARAVAYAPRLADVGGERWLRHIRLLVTSAARIAAQVAAGISVLVHCSDGWDRTPQLTSLAMLLLDPHYCTAAGFATLVEKEWVAFGHKFRDRCRQVPAPHASREQSPIFLQFLDCVHQLLTNHPAAFAFNDTLLTVLADETYAGRFGTFLYNSERERAAGPPTASVWDYIAQRHEAFASRAYVPGTSLYALVCRQPVRVALWDALYLRSRIMHALPTGTPPASTWLEPPF